MRMRRTSSTRASLLGAFGAMMIALVLSVAPGAHNFASSFGLYPASGPMPGKQGMANFGHGSLDRQFSGSESRAFLLSHGCLENNDPGSLVLASEDNDEATECEQPLQVVNGTSYGFIVTELYRVPLRGFTNVRGGDTGGERPSLAPSSIFSADDVTRLRLEPRNVTLPAALILLDPGKYPTQSRARKVIRQRSICICRHGNLHEPSDCSTLKFDELGKVTTRVFPGDIIGFQRREGTNYYALQGVPHRAPPFDLPVVFEDSHMAIVNKPPGVVTYRSEGGRGGAKVGGGRGRDTLLSALPYVLMPSEIAGGSDDGDGARCTALRRPQPVHRLDRPTSGLVVVAKTRDAAVHLSRQFESRKVEKTYTAIVNGAPRANSEGEVSTAAWNVVDRDLEGKSAVTEWRVLRVSRSLHGRDGRLTLVELKPKTGRYHQLRRHMAWQCGSPLVGDTTYGDGDDSALRLRGRGLFLCSNGIELEHPHYNTLSGRKEWDGVEKGELPNGDAVVYDDAGTVMVKAKIALPGKFESFLRHEQSRADKFS